MNEKKYKQIMDQRNQTISKLKHRLDEFNDNDSKDKRPNL